MESLPVDKVVDDCKWWRTITISTMVVIWKMIMQRQCNETCPQVCFGWILFIFISNLGRYPLISFHQHKIYSQYDFFMRHDWRTEPKLFLWYPIISLQMAFSPVSTYFVPQPNWLGQYFCLFSNYNKISWGFGVDYEPCVVFHDDLFLGTHQSSGCQ